MLKARDELFGGVEQKSTSATAYVAGRDRRARLHAPASQAPYAITSATLSKDRGTPKPQSLKQHARDDEQATKRSVARR